MQKIAVTTVLPAHLVGEMLLYYYIEQVELSKELQYILCAVFSIIGLQSLLFLLEGMLAAMHPTQKVFLSFVVQILVLVSGCTCPAEGSYHTESGLLVGKRLLP